MWRQIDRVINDNQERRRTFSLCTATAAGLSVANKLSGTSFIGAHVHGNIDDVGR
jgi:hypothetical protein